MDFIYWYFLYYKVEKFKYYSFKNKNNTNCVLTKCFLMKKNPVSSKAQKLMSVIDLHFSDLISFGLMEDSLLGTCFSVLLWLQYVKKIRPPIWKRAVL